MSREVRNLEVKRAGGGRGGRSGGGGHRGEARYGRSKRDRGELDPKKTRKHRRRYQGASFADSMEARE